MASILRRVQTGGRETLDTAAQVKVAITKALMWPQGDQYREGGICIGF